ncbi:MarR family winged helix-turn-helix transcriptional regulator [Frigoribacterium sp. VKM Ac-2836]|uniref:MarR family winged helix-turn-helix transcriptional regulator n=1 Tax=Frigoribacterium sp. VKM Ac-2836 TaxID=2739014 RepID=UPI0015656E6C|nr:MarR family transcriptional regulator [Frigoribacterium sp. VKM Ac-2836]NRD27337.1 MarR family transcriptional regulator [Frigoribacterium sp. VKM Ac-2836]
MTDSAPPVPPAPRAVPHAHLATDVRGAVLRLARRLRQQKADADVSDAQMAALGYVVQNQPLTIGALTAHEGVTPPSMNRTVGKLVEAGLLRRTVDDDDKRRVLLETTEAGAAFVFETRRRRDEWLVPRLSALTADERRTLAEATEILRKLTRS